MPEIKRGDWVHGQPSSSVTDTLYARLEQADLDAIAAAASPEQAEAMSSAPDATERRRMTLAAGVQHGVPGVRERTGLTDAAPPEDIHSMSRGWMSSGGSTYYADLIAGSVATALVDLVPGSRILDFGCSSGRVVRVLQAWRPDLMYSACDPNREAIEWAKDHLPGIEFFVSETSPPLPHPDAAFDLVYAISIWSHYSEPAARRWFDEMHRLLGAGGVLVITTHGLNTALRPGAAPNHIASSQLLADATAAMLSRGFFYWDCFGEAGDWGVKSPDWGEAFISPEWLVNLLAPRWEMLLYATAAVEGNQDLVILRARPPRPATAVS